MRAIVPAFAGFAGMAPSRALTTLVVASAIWHGTLVRIGLLAGANLEAIMTQLADAGRTLLVVALAVGVAVVAWWWRTRHPGTPA